MLKTILAGLRARTARLVLSSVAIALGVAFVTGTLVLGDAIEAQTKEDFAKNTRNVDAVVTTKDEKLPADIVAQVRKVSGVAGADSREASAAALVGGDGKARNAFVRSLPTTEKLRDVDLKDGRFPQSATETAIDVKTAETSKLSVGNKIKLLDREAGEHEFTVVGTYQQGVNVMSISGMDSAMVTTDGMRAIFPDQSPYEVVAVAAPGVSQQQLVDNLKAALGDKVTLMTGEEFTNATLNEVADSAGQIKLFLLAFALISLVVASMVIYNTFTILIAQRTRELALLRCVGAARGQVFRSVLAEALFMGLAASVMGIFGGLGVSALLQWGISAMGPGSGADGPIRLPMSLMTILAGFGVGVVVTLLAALLPARRATSVAPVSALKSLPDSHDEVARTGKLRIAIAAVVAIAGGALTWFGTTLEQEAAMFTSGAGTMVLLLSVLLLGPVIVGPLNRLFGKVMSGVPAKLASANAGRNPKRTAATTAALMIGVTIVTMVGVVGNSGKETANAQVDKRFPADYTVSSGVYTTPLPEEFVAKLAAVPEVAKIAPQLNVGAETENAGNLYLYGEASDALGDVVRPDVVSGQVNGLRDDQVVLHETVTKNTGLKIGDTVKAKGRSLQVAAIIKGEGFGEGIVTLPTAKQVAHTPPTGYDDVMIKLKPGVDAAAGRAALDKLVATSPVATLNTAAEAKAELNSQIDQVLAFVWALVGLAVIIALFGIANTLTLSVLERTRESALLRALGLTRGQLRQMLVIESIVMALIGAVIGLALGVGFGWVITTAMSTKDFALTFAVPFGTIGLMLAAAVVAAIIAAAMPARRAARTSPVAGMAEA